MKKRWLDGSILRRAIFIYTIIALFLALFSTFWPTIFGGILVKILNDPNTREYFVFLASLVSTIGIMGIIISILYIVFAAKNTWAKLDKENLIIFLILGVFVLFIIVFIPTYIMTIIYIKKIYGKVQENTLKPNKNSNVLIVWEKVNFSFSIILFFLHIYFFAMTIYFIKKSEFDREFWILLTLAILLNVFIYLILIIYIIFIIKKNYLEFSKNQKITIYLFIAIPFLNYIIFLIFSILLQIMQKKIKQKKRYWK